MSEAAQFEPYLPVQKLESGPSTDMYLARHTRLERQVWIKALGPHVPLSSPFAARLEREGQLLARLAHPNVLNILDSVWRPPHAWLVLEAVDGWSLAQVFELSRRAQRTGRVEARGAVALVLQVARALAHAHEAGIVHGAVRPSNILISKTGAVKLTGFTLAPRKLGSADPVSAPGEPAAFDATYLSPEQVLGEGVDERSDLFSLGSVLYELLAGHKAFEGSSESSTAQNVRHQAPAAFRVRSDVSSELERIVLRCLEKQPERRFDSAGQLTRALEHALGARALGELGSLVARALDQAGIAVPSAAPGPFTRSDELRRREATRGLERTLVALLSLCAALALGGAGLHTWLDAQRLAPAPSTGVLPPGQRARLLVVVEPWAHVFVDGEQLETTPFATPLELAPGVRHLRLEHPNAPAEHRRLELAPGQKLVLGVVMRVRGGSIDAGAPAQNPPDAGPPSP